MMPNFPADELRCKCGCGLLRFAPGFLQALQGLRDALGEPMHLTSACRCRAHNDRPLYEGGAGGHYRSLHVGDAPAHPTGGCCAVDVGAEAGVDDDYRERLMALAWARGWSVGLHPRFLHLDLRSAYTSLPQARFTY